MRKLGRFSATLAGSLLFVSAASYSASNERVPGPAREDPIWKIGKAPQPDGKVSPEIRPLNPSASEKEDLVAFMNALTGANRPVVLPALPQ